MPKVNTKDFWIDRVCAGSTCRRNDCPPVVYALALLCSLKIALL